MDILFRSRPRPPFMWRCREWPILRSLSRGGDWASLGCNRPVTHEVYRLRRRRRQLQH